MDFDFHQHVKYRKQVQKVNLSSKKKNLPKYGGRNHALPPLDIRAQSER